MSGLMFADLDQRRTKLMEDIQTQIRENKTLRAEGDRVSSINAVFQKHLHEARQVMVSLTSQISAAEQRKSALDSVIASEQQRINDARDELTQAEDACRKARQECTQAFDTATSDLRQCYISDYNKDILSAKIVQENEQLQSLRREALMIKASALALNSNAENEDRLIEQLREQQNALLETSERLSAQMDVLDKEHYPSNVDKEVAQLRTLLEDLSTQDASTVTATTTTTGAAVAGAAAGANRTESEDQGMGRVLNMARAIEAYGLDAMVAVLSKMKSDTLSMTNAAAASCIGDHADNDNDNGERSEGASTEETAPAHVSEESPASASPASSPNNFGMRPDVVCGAILADGAQCSSSIAGSLATVVDDALAKAQEQSEAIREILQANP